MNCSFKRTSLRIANFQAYEQSEHLDTEVTSINIISKEEIICVRRKPPYPKQLD